jgi:sec-independent protein translocase protein TatB
LFGLSWDQIILILLAALFLLGPERIPTAIKWLMDSLRKVRSFAAGAQSEMRSQLGPELDELRRQIAELQSLKEIQELRQLRELDPRKMVGKNLLGSEFSGGISGFLGLNGEGPDAAASAASAAAQPVSPAGVPPAATTVPAENPPATTLAPNTPPAVTSSTPSSPEPAGAEAATPPPASTPAGQWGDVT